MSDARRLLGLLTYRLEQIVDPLKLRLKKSLGLLGPLQILAYKGHGTADELFLKGRVLEAKGIARAGEKDTLHSNIAATLRRFSSVEIPGARVQARFNDISQVSTANEEGYFDIRLKLPAPIETETLWHKVEYTLAETEYSRGKKVRSTGKVLIPPSNCRFGVISDIDDTIIETHATNFMKMVQITLLKSAKSRLPFSGVAAFYRALQKGIEGKPVNPIFYVSRSVWNLYDLMEDFLDINGIPSGPLLLRDHSIEFARGTRSRPEFYKHEQISKILDFYDPLKFILIGDSGQKDTAIYHEIARRYPGRVLAIYIRDVGIARRRTDIFKMARELKEEQGLDLVLARNTREAAEHAIENGFIDAGSISEIVREAEKDEI